MMYTVGKVLKMSLNSWQYQSIVYNIFCLFAVETIRAHIV